MGYSKVGGLLESFSNFSRQYFLFIQTLLALDSTTSLRKTVAVRRQEYVITFSAHRPSNDPFTHFLLLPF